MSGFEIIGVVLGVLPLIITAIEDYEKIIDPVVTFRKYSKALQTFTTELNVQRDIFQNECIWILSRFVDGHDLEDMLKDPSHHLRRTIRGDKALDGRVSKSLGSPYRQLRDILILISDSLNDIYEDTRDLRADLSRPKTEDSLDFKAWRHHTKQKLKLSLGKTTLNRRIEDLRHRNQAFLAISQQIARFSTSWTPSQSQQDLQLTDKNLEKVKRLREASKTLYHHLEKLWSCPRHSEHSVNLRLCLETSELYKDASTAMSFDMALTYCDKDLDGQKDQGPVWLAIESTAETVVLTAKKGKSAVRFADAADEQTQPSPIQRQHSAGLEMPEKSGFRKFFQKLKGERVREAGKGISAVPSVPSAKVQTVKDPVPQRDSSVTIRKSMPAKDEPTPLDLSAVSDLCHHILESSKLEAAMSQPCIGSLSGLGEDRYTVYNKSKERADLSEMVSLTSMICNTTRVRSLSKSEKWRVAGALSLAVLLYNSTPWLQNVMKSDDILFINSINLENPQVTKAPHLHSLGNKANVLSHGNRNLEDSWVKNQMLYCLGIVLLEIEFGDRLENLIEWTKLPDSPRLDEPLTRQLQLLKRRSGEQLGTLYGRIVRMCLDCDFGLGLDEYTLQDPRVQKVFYSQVVTQFQERMPEYSKIWSDE